MSYCIDIFDHIKKVKEKLKNNMYQDQSELERDFTRLNELTGINTNKTEYKNLKENFTVQEFLIDEVCKIHEEENDLKNKRVLEDNIDIKKAFMELKDGRRAYNIYSFNEKEYEYYIIGDLHSDTVSLWRILKICGFFQSIVSKEKKRFIFLGDYVDRGRAHLKNLEFVLALKYFFPEFIFLLKGNHDDGAFEEGRVKLSIKKPEDEEDDDYFLLYLNNLLKKDEDLRRHVINSYLRFFNSLCNIAFVNSSGVILMAVHGGIPRPRKNEPMYFNYIKSLCDLTNSEIKDSINRSIVSNMLWSDPSNNNFDLRENNGRFRFTEEHFDKFKGLINFDYFVRGHEAFEDGYKTFFKDRLYSIFSSGAILKNKINVNNETAYGVITPKIMRFSKGGQISFLNLND